jgi:hypothetical protein
MDITIQEPGGPRQGVVPSEGIQSEAALMKFLIITLATESDFCVGNVTLRVDLTGVSPTRLVAIAKMIAVQGNDPASRTSTHHYTDPPRPRAHDGRSLDSDDTQTEAPLPSQPNLLCRPTLWEVRTPEEPTVLPMFLAQYAVAA